MVGRRQWTPGRRPHSSPIETNAPAPWLACGPRLVSGVWLCLAHTWYAMHGWCCMTVTVQDVG